MSTFSTKTYIYILHCIFILFFEFIYLFALYCWLYDIHNLLLRLYICNIYTLNKYLALDIYLWKLYFKNAIEMFRLLVCKCVFATQVTIKSIQFYCIIANITLNTYNSRNKPKRLTFLVFLFCICIKLFSIQVQ